MADVTRYIYYEKLQDIAARVDAEEGICQGLEDVKNGKVRPAREFFEEFESNHGVPNRQSSSRRA
ncbi:MAG TPA: hypothetical protein VN974_08710 [Candidatus Dormibacteraeota bacterium]|jgi:hypothetical protein|nr:hypothetical protein [Candidatus Dormibacteraeota bacterium]